MRHLDVGAAPARERGEVHLDAERVVWDRVDHQHVAGGLAFERRDQFRVVLGAFVLLPHAKRDGDTGRIELQRVEHHAVVCENGGGERHGRLAHRFGGVHPAAHALGGVGETGA